MVRYHQKPDADDKKKKVTYMSTDQIRCPICDHPFKTEILFGGRLNAGDLTDELHRRYIPLKAYGEVHPLIYEVMVCPSCFYAAYKNDFAALKPKDVSAISDGESERIAAMERVFGPVDFNESRDLIEGAASYYLAMLCYERQNKDLAPTFKQGLSALRAAWLCDDLNAKRPGENFDYVAQIFYRKARFLYRHAVELEQTGKERFSLQKNLGPDTDKSYGYDGVIYLSGVLELKYGPKDDEAKRAEALETSKRNVAKLFGLGKSSKSKPGPLLDKARDLYDQIKHELHQEDDD